MDYRVINTVLLGVMFAALAGMAATLFPWVIYTAGDGTHTLNGLAALPERHHSRYSGQLGYLTLVSLALGALGASPYYETLLTFSPRPAYLGPISPERLQLRLLCTMAGGLVPLILIVVYRVEVAGIPGLVASSFTAVWYVALGFAALVMMVPCLLAARA